VTDAWYAVSDSTRRQILARVAAGPCSVGEITDALPVSMSAVSQHLKILREAGLVSMTPAGRRRIYQARLEGLAELRAELDTYWTQALHSFKQVAEDSYRAETTGARSGGELARPHAPSEGVSEHSEQKEQQ
jgi:DNA-binding transcriptional ArsR family regulator